jgi:hypothetical protein
MIEICIETIRKGRGEGIDTISIMIIMHVDTVSIRELLKKMMVIFIWIRNSTGPNCVRFIRVGLEDVESLMMLVIRITI